MKELINAKKRNLKARNSKVEQFKKENNGEVFCEVCKEDEELEKKLDSAKSELKSVENPIH